MLERISQRPSLAFARWPVESIIFGIAAFLVYSERPAVMLEQSWMILVSGFVGY